MIQQPHSLALRAACLLAMLSLPSAMNASSETNQVLFDVRANPSPDRWEIVNDGVMGGLSMSRMVVSNAAAVFSGTVSLENNGGFASVRTRPEPMNCAGCDALRLRVRGDGKRYKVTARTTQRWDAPQYQQPFETRAGEWQEILLPLERFKASFRGRPLPEEPPLDAAKLMSIGFLISDKQAGPFRLELEWIQAVTTPRPPDSAP